MTLLSSRFKGASKSDSIQGVRIIRIAGLYSIFLFAPLKILSLRKNFDAIVDVALFGIPFFSRLFVSGPIMTICYHLPRETFSVETANYGLPGRFLAALATQIEDRLFPLIYRRVPLLTFSEATKRDLVSIGFQDSSVRVADRALAHVMLTNSFETAVIAKRMRSYGTYVKRTSDPSFVCLGRLKKYKGVQDAIRAMTQLVPHYPNSRLAVVGAGDYEAELKNLSVQLNIKENVDFLGYVEFDTKVKLLKEATALIMPSYKEGFPTPVLEAQACGTPVVASSAPGVQEYVGRDDGFIFPVGDWKGIASLLFKVIENNGNGYSERESNGNVLSDSYWQEKEHSLVILVESCFHERKA